MTVLWFEPSLEPDEDPEWERYCDRLSDNSMMFDDISGFVEWLHGLNLLPPAVEILSFDCGEPEIEYDELHHQTFEVEYSTHYVYTDPDTGESWPVTCWADIVFDLKCDQNDKYAYTVKWEFSE